MVIMAFLHTKNMTYAGSGCWLMVSLAPNKHRDLLAFECKQNNGIECKPKPKDLKPTRQHKCYSRNFYGNSRHLHKKHNSLWDCVTRVCYGIFSLFQIYEKKKCWKTLEHLELFDKFFSLIKT